MKKRFIPVLALALSSGSCRDSTSPDAGVESVGTASDALTQAFQLTIPNTFVYSGYSLGALESLRINDGAEVTGSVFNIGQGGGETNIGVNAVVGPITSGAPLVLRNGAHVTGDVTTAGEPTLNPGAVIDGELFPNEPLVPATRTLTADFGNGSGGPVSLEPDEFAAVSPGSYTDLHIKSNAILELASGRYYFDQLIMEPSSELRADDAGGVVQVFVKGTVILRGRVGAFASGSPGLFIAATGTSFVSVEAEFSGTLFAPNAPVTFQVSGPFAGQAFAKSIDLHQYLDWDFHPSNLWESVLDPIDPPHPAEPPVAQAGDGLPNDAVGDAIRDYIAATHASLSAQARVDAIRVLRSLPPNAVVAALAAALETSTSVSYSHALVYTAADLVNVATLPLIESVLSTPIPSWDDSFAHGGRIVPNATILLRAVRGLDFMVRSNIAAARQPLVDAATTHPLRLVRKEAIWRIQRSGDSDLRDDMEAALDPVDAPLLEQDELTPDERLTGLPIPNTGDSDDTSEPGPSEGGEFTDGGAGGTGGAAGAGGTGPGGGAGGSGGTGGGTCDESSAVDLGNHGNNETVANDACLRVRDSYPSWWDDHRVMKLETTAGGTYPTPFTWSNACTQSGGSDVFTGEWQARFLSSTSEGCATLIDLGGNGAGNITLRYWDGGAL